MVHRQQGEGTTVEALLSFCPAATTSDKITYHEKPAAPQGHECVLFVDDDPAIADIYQILLGRMGYQMVSHTSSVQALKQFRADPHHFDVVVTDQGMPQLAGLELAKQMLQIRPDIPIILCTGYSDTVDRDRALACGIREFALKPVIAKELVSLIRRVLATGPS